MDEQCYNVQSLEFNEHVHEEEDWDVAVYINLEGKKLKIHCPNLKDPKY